MHTCTCTHLGVLTRGATEGGVTCVVGNFQFWIFEKMVFFLKRPQWAEIRDFWYFLRYLRLFHIYIDDFKPQNHHFLKKIFIFSKNLPIIKKNCACGAKILGYFLIFSAQKLGFFAKCHPLLRPAIPTNCTPGAHPMTYKSRSSKKRVYPPYRAEWWGVIVVFRSTAKATIDFC